jgi:FkbM family methyltransferase
MDLYHHYNPLFTKWAVASGMLNEPFVVIDIGVQGGEHPRWQQLGPFAEIHGFDPIDEVIEELRRSAVGQPHRHYHNLALGDEDGERRFFVSANRFGSSFFSSDAAAEERTVTIRRLDSLLRDELVPRANYVKLDCEGFEPEILKGARQYLASSDVLCVTAETNFHLSPVYPRTHFHAINEIMVDHRLLVFDINEVRSPAPAYAAAMAAKPWPRPDPCHDNPPLVVGRPGTCDVLFCRDLVAERRDPDHFRRDGILPHPASADMVIKSMINFELHGLMDCAVELAVTFRDLLAPRFNVDEAIGLLLAPAPHPRNTADVTLCLSMIGALRAQISQPQTSVLSLLARDAGDRLLQPMRRGLRRIIGDKVTKC